MIRILVTYATQGEFVEIPFPPMIGNEEVQAGYLRTGIGKVKSAFHLTNALKDIKPDVVLNVGTAGTASHQVGDVLVCRSFIDRDLQKTAGLAHSSASPLLSKTSAFGFAGAPIFELRSNGSSS